MHVKRAGFAIMGFISTGGLKSRLPLFETVVTFFIITLLKGGWKIHHLSKRPEQLGRRPAGL